MKTLIQLLAVTLLLSLSVNLQAKDNDLKALGESYFKAWQGSQMPDANKEALENYLSFLTDDVGHQHLPYDPDATRESDGKASMREGMTYYLGIHTEYKSELTELITGHNVVIIKYTTSAKGIHPQTKQEVIIKDETIEVLEIEDGKVAVIRKYSD